MKEGATGEKGKEGEVAKEGEEGTTGEKGKEGGVAKEGEEGTTGEKGEEGKVVGEEGSTGKQGTKAAIYGSEKLAVTIADKQTVIHNFEGFGSVNLSGGILEGNLTGKGEKSVVTLTSGEYRGGAISNVKGVTIDGKVHLHPMQSPLPSSESETALKPIKIDAPVTLTKDANPVLYKTHPNPALLTANNGDSSIRAVTMKSMTMENGASATVMLDLSENTAQREKPHLTIDKTLSIHGSNKVIGSLVVDDTNPEAVYNTKKKLYDGKTHGPVTFTAIKAGSVQTVEGANVLSTESSDPLIEMRGKFDEVGTSYLITTSYPSDPVKSLEKSGLSHNKAVVASALQEAAFKAEGADARTGLSTGASMDQAISQAGYNEAAREAEWSPNNSGAQAVAVIQQKSTQAISRHMDSNRTGISTGDMFQSRGVWGEYHYSDGERDSKDDVEGYKTKINGITLGVDMDMDNSVRSGLAFTYGNSKVDTKGVDHSIDGDTYVGTIYSGWNYSGYFIDGMLSYGWGSSDYQRNGPSLGSYKGKGDHSLWSGRLVSGYNIQAEQWVIQPQAELSYTRIKLDEMTESGAGLFAEKVNFSDYDIFELGAGIKAFGELETGSGMLKPEVSLMGYHDFKDDKHSVNAVIINGNRAYPVSGDRDQNRFLFEAGLSFKAANNLSLGVSYNYNWMDNYKAHGANVSLRYDF